MFKKQLGDGSKPSKDTILEKQSIMRFGLLWSITILGPLGELNKIPGVLTVLSNDDMPATRTVLLNIPDLHLFSQKQLPFVDSCPQFLPLIR